MIVNIFVTCLGCTLVGEMLTLKSELGCWFYLVVVWGLDRCGVL